CPPGYNCSPELRPHPHTTAHHAHAAARRTPLLLARGRCSVARQDRCLAARCMEGGATARWTRRSPQWSLTMESSTARPGSAHCSPLSTTREGENARQRKQLAGRRGPLLVASAARPSWPLLGQRRSCPPCSVTARYSPAWKLAEE
ncbi:hypothetical protein Dimus_031487, partial [Dionaea muscipula]